MIRLENIEVTGWKHAIRGMRNPMNSWHRSDNLYGTYWGDIDGHQCFDNDSFCIGENDLALMTKLRNAGTDHRKFMRMITVYMDITAPLYWWKEFDTYKVGTVANSCSTMHKIADKEFTIDDFSCEHLLDRADTPMGRYSPYAILDIIVDTLNSDRELYLDNHDKKYWWQMIQLLPSSYNQKRTVMLNYEILTNMYHARKNHKLDEWVEFCSEIEKLPYSELIVGGKQNG